MVFQFLHPLVACLYRKLLDNTVGKCENKRYATVGDTTEGLGRRREDAVQGLMPSNLYCLSPHARIMGWSSTVTNYM